MIQTKEFYLMKKNNFKKNVSLAEPVEASIVKQN